MPRITQKNIINEATEIKNFIEKNKKLPKYCTINNNQYSIYTTAYLISRAIANLKADTFNVKAIGKSNQGFSVKLNENCSKTTYLDMISRFNDYCNKNNRVPSYVITIRNKADFTTYLYGVCKILNYYKQNNTLPNSCLFTSSYIDVNQKATTKTKTEATKPTSTSKKTSGKTKIYTSKPHLLTTAEDLGQKFPYSCGANLLQQLLKKLLGITIPETTLMSWAGTTTAGTNHLGLETAIAMAAKKYKVNLQVTWKNFSDMGKTIDERFEAVGKLMSRPDTAVGWHIGYQDSGEKATGTIIGHYEEADKIDTVNKRIRALNSLGYKVNANAYQGHLQWRTYALQAHYAANTPGGQPALMIVTKK